MCLVGLSRKQTQENQRPRTRDRKSMDLDPLQNVETIKYANVNGHMNGYANGSAHGKPFTEDELTQAMTRTTLRPTSAGKA